MSRSVIDLIDLPWLYFAGFVVAWLSVQQH